MADHREEEEEERRSLAEVVDSDSDEDYENLMKALMANYRQVILQHRWGLGSWSMFLMGAMFILVFPLLGMGPSPSTPPSPLILLIVPVVLVGVLTYLHFASRV